MDGSRFDDLARSLVVSGSRRRLIAGLGAALAAFGVGRTEAAACRAPGRTCREHANCCSGVCGPKDATGRRTCQCQSAADCPATPGECHAPTCEAGACVAGICAADESCLHGGCYRTCAADDTPCMDGSCGVACECVSDADATVLACVDIDFFIGSCATDADCPTGTFCDPHHVDGQGRNLCVRPCPCPT